MNNPPKIGQHLEYSGSTYIVDDIVNGADNPYKLRLVDESHSFGYKLENMEHFIPIAAPKLRFYAILKKYEYLIITLAILIIADYTILGGSMRDRIKLLRDKIADNALGEKNV